MTDSFNSINSVAFQNKLINWFKKNKRDLPWRNTNHWYTVFISEFLLQQTQVEQALPYYQKLIMQFPDIFSLSRASEQELLGLWAGLGYYSRARNLLKSARILTTNFNGEFPTNFDRALSLPGIGRYTASAILSIAFKKQYAVVDGNVSRAITRLYAIPDDIRLGATQKKIQAICDQLLPREEPGNFNEGLMELGATICQKQKPDCGHCPLQSDCLAYSSNTQHKYPYKSAARKKRKIFQYAFILEFDGKYLMVQKPDSGLLASLWEFPVIQIPDFNSNDPVKLILNKYKVSGKVIETGKEFRHQYSHIDLKYKPLVIKVQEAFQIDFDNYISQVWLTLKDIDALPVHNAHVKLINWLKSLSR